MHRERGVVRPHDRLVGRDQHDAFVEVGDDALQVTEVRRGASFVTAVMRLLVRTHSPRVSAPNRWRTNEAAGLF